MEDSEDEASTQDGKSISSGASSDQGGGDDSSGSEFSGSESDSSEDVASDISDSEEEVEAPLPAKKPKQASDPLQRHANTREPLQLWSVKISEQVWRGHGCKTLMTAGTDWDIQQARTGGRRRCPFSSRSAAAVSPRPAQGGLGLGCG